MDTLLFLGNVLNVLAQAEAGGGLSLESAKMIGAALAIGLGGIGPGLGIGIGVMGATQAIGRNPDAEGPVRTTMILGLGLAEAVAIYALVVALVILFV